MDHQANMAFVRACRHAFATLFQMDVEVGDPLVWSGGGAAQGVRSRVVLRGGVEGRFELAMPVETARRLATVLTGTEVGPGDEALPDALGVIAETIAGGGAAGLSESGATLSCPETAFGVHLAMPEEGVAAGVRIPCVCDCGEFTLGVLVRAGGGRAGRAAA